MPQKMPLAHAERKAVVKHAFEVFLLLFLVRERRVEERRGRQLLGIADDDRRFGARKRTDRFRRGHLRRFVEYNGVEKIGLRGQILRHGRGAHEHARAGDFHQRGHFGKQSPQPHAAQPRFGKARKRRRLDGKRTFLVMRRQPRKQLRADIFARKTRKFFRTDPEFFDRFFERAHRHARQIGIGGYVDFKEILINVLLETGKHVFAFESAAFESVGKEGQAERGKLLRRLAVHAPVGQHVDIVDERARFGRVIVEHVVLADLVAVGADHA